MGCCNGTLQTGNITIFSPILCIYYLHKHFQDAFSEALCHSYFWRCSDKRCLRKLFPSQDIPEGVGKTAISTLSCSLIRQRFFPAPHFHTITTMQKQQQFLTWERQTQNTFFSFTAEYEDGQHSLTCNSSKGHMCSPSGNRTAAALGLCPFCLPYLSFCHLLIFHYFDILFW